MFKASVNSIPTSLAGDITATATTFYVIDDSRIPEPPNLLVLGENSTQAETVKLVEKNGMQLTVERGFQGVARAWSAGTTISRNFTAYDHDTFITNIEEVDNNMAGLGFMQVGSKLYEHIFNTNNPHNVTKEQLGLDAILNAKKELNPERILVTIDNLNNYITSGFYEFIPVPPSTFPNSLIHAPTLPENYFSLIVDVYHSIEVSNDQTPHIYQWACAVTSDTSFYMLRFSRDNGNSFSEWTSIVPTNHASELPEYGVATDTLYGHTRVLDVLNSISSTDALSANMGRELSEKLVEATEQVKGYADNLSLSLNDRINTLELEQFETGEWTPEHVGLNPTFFTTRVDVATWVRRGNIVFLYADLLLTRTMATTTSTMVFDGLPFVPNPENPQYTLTDVNQVCAFAPLILSSGIINIFAAVSPLNHLTFTNISGTTLNNGNLGHGTAVGNTLRVRFNLMYKTQI